ncbi:hypothetical protein ACTQ5K_02850 [Niallia sp. Sow4_A1]|uniref:hypothetical protein n=1 Tax=Niallia sp. Sow4_A1 TaxID=3438793 RepID=UPI003F9A08CB
MKLKHAELGNLHQIQEELQRLIQESEHFNNPNFTFSLEGVYRGLGDIIALNKIWDERIGEENVNSFEEMRKLIRKSMKETGHATSEIKEAIKKEYRDLG